MRAPMSRHGTVEAPTCSASLAKIAIKHRSDVMPRPRSLLRILVCPRSSHPRGKPPQRCRSHPIHMLGIDHKIAGRAPETPPRVVSGAATPIFSWSSRNVRLRCRSPALAVDPQHRPYCNRLAAVTSNAQQADLQRLVPAYCRTGMSRKPRGRLNSEHRGQPILKTGTTKRRLSSRSVPGGTCVSRPVTSRR
jgi:hypothetical protein